MPFCRECGKQVEDDWVSCPFCSQPIGPPASAMLGVQDSVVMGDINISKSGGESTPCSYCGASGSVKLACVDCKEHCTCDKCENRYLKNLFSDSYEFLFSFDSGLMTDGTISPDVRIRCKTCYVVHAETKCKKTCSHCLRKFEPFNDVDYNNIHCNKCTKLIEEIESAEKIAWKKKLSSYESNLTELEVLNDGWKEYWEYNQAEIDSIMEDKLGENWRETLQDTEEDR